MIQKQDFGLAFLLRDSMAWFYTMNLRHRLIALKHNSS